MKRFDKRPLWHIGFRPFFLGAGLWAVVAMSLWLGTINFGWFLRLNDIPPSYWHAHEMIFGYAMAVIAGFLLTAVPSWTNSKPVSGLPLIVLFSIWLAARLLFLIGDQSWFVITASVDLLFMVVLWVVLAVPIIKCRQYRQAGILAKILLMSIANVLFYLGAAGILENGVHYGLYGAFYLIIALILTISRRVMPMFIENGLKLTTPLRNRKWIDISSILLFLVFWVCEILSINNDWSASAALVLFVAHVIRLYDWYPAGIWTKPLLWVLYLSYAFIVFGFGIKAASLIGIMVVPVLALHLFAIGGIGLITCGMMSRVSLGHTGRNIHDTSPWLGAVFLCIVAAAIVRVFFPIFDMQHYLLWVALSSAFWIIGFAGFVVIYGRMLVSARVDTKIN